MAFTAQDFERYMNRHVSVSSKVHGVLHGRFVGMYGSSEEILLFEEDGVGSTEDKRKLLSYSTIDVIFDRDPVWNKCEECGAEPGIVCEGNHGFSHHCRFAFSLMNAYTNERKSKTYGDMMLGYL